MIFSKSILPFVLSICVVTGAFIDFSSVKWAHIFDPVPKFKIDNFDQTTEKSSHLIREEVKDQYENAVKEIQIRIEHEHNLFLYQFIVLGGIFAILFTSGYFKSFELNEIFENDNFQLILGVTSLVLIIVDIHIRFNSQIICQLGEWIKVAYENNDQFCWEHYLCENGPFHAAPWFVISVQTLFFPTIFVLLGYYALFFFKKTDKIKNIRTWIFTFVQFGLLSFAWFNLMGARPEYSILKKCQLINLLILWLIVTFTGCGLRNQIFNFQKSITKAP